MSEEQSQPLTEKQRLDNLIRQRRAQAAKDALSDALKRGLTTDETNTYIISATTNALWDAQQGLPYRLPMYEPPPPKITGPMYHELGFLNGQTLEEYFATKR
jgi:hypothetical protein